MERTEIREIVYFDWRRTTRLLFVDGKMHSRDIRRVFDFEEHRVVFAEIFQYNRLLTAVTLDTRRVRSSPFLERIWTSRPSFNSTARSSSKLYFVDPVLVGRAHRASRYNPRHGMCGRP